MIKSFTFSFLLFGILVIFSSCDSNQKNVLTNFVNPTDFSTPVHTRNRLSKAYKTDDFIFGSSPKDEQFIVTSISKSKVVEKIDGNRGIVGPFSYKKNTIYTPIYYKPKQISKTNIEDILQEYYNQEMFAVKSIHFYGDFIFVVAKNGCFIFDEETHTLINSFKNTNNCSSAINYYFNKETKLLYVANFKEEIDKFFVVCADAKNNFKEIWRTKLEGSLSDSGDFYMNGIYESKKHLVCPSSYNRKNDIKIINKHTGTILHEFPTKANYSIVYQKEKMFAKGFRKNKVVCIDLESLNEVWDCEYNGDGSDLFIFENKLLLGYGKQGTFSIDIASGKSEIINKKMNVRPIFEEDLRPSQQYFIVDSYLCW